MKSTTMAVDTTRNDSSTSRPWPTGSVSPWNVVQAACFDDLADEDAHVAHDDAQIEQDMHLRNLKAAA